MRIFRKLFEFIVFVQLFLFFFFILENINNLNAVDFNYDVDGNSDTVSVNFYSLIAVIVAIIIIGIIAGFNFWGSGFNDTSTKLFQKYLSIISIITLLFVGSNYYILQIGYVGQLFDILIIAVYGLYLIEMLIGNNSITIDE